MGPHALERIFEHHRDFLIDFTSVRLSQHTARLRSSSQWLHPYPNLEPCIHDNFQDSSLAHFHLLRYELHYLLLDLLLMVYFLPQSGWRCDALSNLFRTIRFWFKIAMANKIAANICAFRVLSLETLHHMRLIVNPVHLYVTEWPAMELRAIGWNMNSRPTFSWYSPL